jgi:hypothetical protein
MEPVIKKGIKNMSVQELETEMAEADKAAVKKEVLKELYYERLRHQE